MKKLLASLSAFVIGTSSITSVVACSVPTKQIEVTVTGSDGTKYETKDFDNDIATGKVALTLTKLLEGITYSDSKYSTASKREQQRKFLGTNGLNLSLDNVLKDENLKDNTNGGFAKSYAAARNTNFTNININADVDTFNNGDAPVFLVNRNYNDKNEFVSDTIINDDASAYKGLKTGSLLSDWKKAIGKSDEDATAECGDNATCKEEVQKLKALELKDVKLLGKYNLSKEADGTLAVGENNTPIASGKVNDKFRLYADDSGQKIQFTNTLVYAESESAINTLTMTYDDPGKDMDNYTIKYEGINKMALVFSFRGLVLSSKTDDRKYDQYIFWYEPVGYQFKNEIIPSTNGQDVFSMLGNDFKPQVTIDTAKVG
ncbi:hypothetical protein SCHIN_v1c00280 [Spiroplasma chinense]|uniref:Lipoprotein n=1 Tax=Spiroplasma chinense TaxID=216932 RepID=A0A5B9Y3H5_9MOLU|nr:hypothetical protein [Spiroplasma chinense]QEH61226.1 hypothetical protein SCHIN_v1c00280 [Spiroplasma chinense]